ncbi:uncharacterized protein LOC135223605 isoform X2 [Macrobrachium nipponense]|uniref:uncharacterized protein LOC135223605 isoform X2 n=1 Tax=Macrobrachium nipponense TaxID=159736 RepID=UPI0030C8B0D7
MKPPVKKWHISDCGISIFICVLSLCGALGKPARSECSLSCYVQDELGTVEDNDVCAVQYLPADECTELSSAIDDAPHPDISPTTGIVSEDRQFDLIHLKSSARFFIRSRGAVVNLTLSSKYSQSMVIIAIISAEPLAVEQCTLIYFINQSSLDHYNFEVQCLTLEPGLYSVAVLDVRPTSPHPEKYNNLQNAQFSSLSALLQRGFTVMYSDQYILEKRHRSKQDNLWRSNDSSNKDRCPCYICMGTDHFYDSGRAILKFTYTVRPSTNECCKNCSSLNLMLFQYKMVDNQVKCQNLNYTRPVVRKFHQVTLEKNVTESPIYYPNVATGCYAFRLRPLINPSPIYHGFFWLEAEGEVFNMDEWNTTFFLQPYSAQSLDVQWTAPPYPYNFSRYELQVWHHKNFSITCRGKSPHGGSIDMIPDRGKITLATTSYSFSNLSSGWYCARVTPIDHRCPRDGCQTRSSLAKLLAAFEDDGVDDQEEYQELLVLCLVGAGVAVITAGASLACVIVRCRPSHGVLHVVYSKVNGVETLKGVQEVLLVWTAAGIDGPHLAPVIHAFKKLLISYSRCKVYDYLDLMSLPDAQREHFLQSPTSWLDWVLNQQHIKIVVVGSNGGRRRQLEWVHSQRMCASPDLSQGLMPQDVVLFPYLLRQLQDRPDLATDYSRLFHVRFSDIYDDSAELEGMVSWARYRIPQHMRALTLALHEVSDDDFGSCFEEPSAEVMVELMTVLAAHPGLVVTNNPHYGMMQHPTGDNQFYSLPSHSTKVKNTRSGSVSDFQTLESSLKKTHVCSCENLPEDCGQSRDDVSGVTRSRIHMSKCQSDGGCSKQCSLHSSLNESALINAPHSDINIDDPHQGDTFHAPGPPQGFIGGAT